MSQPNDNERNRKSNQQKTRRNNAPINNKDDDDGKPINEITDPDISVEDEEYEDEEYEDEEYEEKEDKQEEDEMANRMRSEDNQKTSEQAKDKSNTNAEYVCPEHQHEEDNDDEEKAKMILEAKSILLEVEDDKLEKKQKKQKKEKEKVKEKEPLITVSNKGNPKIISLKDKLNKLESEYSDLLISKPIFVSEEEEYNAKIESLTREYENEVQTRKYLSHSLNEINIQVNKQYSNATEKVTAPKTIKMPNITSTLLLKTKEETNLNKLTNILQIEASKYESIYKQYNDPKTVEKIQATLENINTKKQSLEEELVTLKRIYESHSKCLEIERKLEQKLKECQSDHADILVSYVIKNKTNDQREPNNSQTTKRKEHHRPIQTRPIQSNKPRYKNKQLQANTCFDEYVKSFPSALKDKKQKSHQSIWDNHTQLPQLTLFKPEEAIVLKELIPQEQYQNIESRFNAINTNRRKIHQQLHQEAEFYKHTNEKLIQEHYDNIAKIDQEKRRNKILILDLKKDITDGKTVKSRIKELNKLIATIQSQCSSIEKKNRDLKETIELLSTSASLPLHVK